MSLPRKPKGTGKKRKKSEPTEMEEEEKKLKSILSKTKVKAEKTVEKAEDKITLLRISKHPIALTLKKSLEAKLAEVKTCIAALKVAMKEPFEKKKIEEKVRKSDSAVEKLNKDVALATSLGD